MNDLFRVRQVITHPYSLLTLAALFWAGNVVLGRDVAGRIPPVTLNSLRWAIALLVLMPIAWPQLVGKGKIVWAHWGQLLLLAVPSVTIYNTFIYLGTRTTTATNAGLIVGTMPIATLVLAILAGQERATVTRVAGFVASFIGVACIIAKDDLTTIHHLSFSSGDLFILGAALSWAAYSVLLRHFAIPLGPFALLALLSAFGLALCIPFCVLELAGGERILWSFGTIAAIIYVGMVPSVIATICWNEAVARVGASTAAIFFNLVPVFAVVMAITLLAESLTLFQLIGMGLIFIGIWLTTKRVALVPYRKRRHFPENLGGIDVRSGAQSLQR
jgi:drug/metabolite transporter (DMT)-like permease